MKLAVVHAKVEKERKAYFKGRDEEKKLSIQITEMVNEDQKRRREAEMEKGKANAKIRKEIAEQKIKELKEVEVPLNQTIIHV